MSHLSRSVSMYTNLNWPHVYIEIVYHPHLKKDYCTYFGLYIDDADCKATSASCTAIWLGTLKCLIDAECCGADAALPICNLYFFTFVAETITTTSTSVKSSATTAII
uniref:Uncharacterized protein n=1 Tax=Strongyloides venezuelensis TaxID=75913 RepID=A0A0K0EUD9_STRVS